MVKAKYPWKGRVNTLKKLPIGIDGFEKIRTNDFYYIDKTMFIADLLRNWGEVNLFTRPRRFGKSLNMSMLKAFFEIGGDRSLFDGLKISQEKKLCEEYMGKYPVISISLKGINGFDFESCKAQLRMVVGWEAERFGFLLTSDHLTENDREKYRALTSFGDGSYKMEDVVLENSLQILSQLLFKHYGTKVILLIDEYDVPLDKAFQAGYYDEMVLLLRNLFGNALKTNEYLYFAVLTGCLRISKESIFTGLNNLKVHTITDSRYDEYFGFTESDVREMLEFYSLKEYADTMKDWYDGFRFGNVSVYCPWDVINYCDMLLADPEAEPENFWSNTSGNGMVRRFIGRADQRTRKEIECLIAGDGITKVINQELTYNELDRTIDHLWSVLFTTGYLTQKGRKTGREYELVIPNKEIRELFVSQIQEWFRDETRADTGKLERFCMAFPKGEAAVIEEMLNDYLWKSISIRDTAVRTERKESFYHGLLLGLLQFESNWEIESNAESGEGYSDISIRTQHRTGVVIEVKYAGDGNLEKSCTEALEQIEARKYDAALRRDGMKEIVRYGIAFYKKNCRVTSEGKGY
ncbi:AAA family ATPase [Roseburia hominis]